MTLRFLIALLVFAGSFALGLFATYAVISRNSGQGIHAVPSPAQARASEQAGAAGAAGGQGSGQVQVAASPATLRPEDGQEPRAASPSEGDATLGTLPDTPPPGSDGAEGGAGTAGGSAKDVGEEAAPTWWSGLVGTRCVVRLDEAGFSGLSVRDGAIEDGERIDWGSRFGKAKKVGSVRAKGSAVVLVEALGFGADGVPNAALVTVPGRKTARGVISLQVEGKQIRLEPAAEGAGNE